MAVHIPEHFNLGFVGAGKMAESITRGVIESGVLPASRICTAHSRVERRDIFEKIGVKIYRQNAEVAENCHVIILSVKPQKVKEVVLELRPLLSKEKLLVSVAAGVKLKDLQEWAGHGRVIRVMPNTPAAVGEAASVMSLGEIASSDDETAIANIFGAVGKIWKADEKCFDAITGLSGSGPAYVYLAIEALADGGVAAGLPRDLALALASQTELAIGTQHGTNSNEKRTGDAILKKIFRISFH
ncbi:pyrroline-5-carboxylate reductase isoform X2 [Aristolochia californica]|uniref:pyrroline-5-carboxylate reductase isoform X2 n=1 Tax=Aristolochia californica TaxID=171875 RepID=UPI0035DF88FF